MKAKLKKTLSDLTSSPKKALLVIAALAIGILGVGAVLVSYTILTNDLNQNYQRTVPCHVVITSNQFDKLNLSEFEKNADVEAAELRDFTMLRIEIETNVWIPLWIFGVQDFNTVRVAKIFHEKGNKIPEPGTMLMERDGLNVSDIVLGKSPRVRAGSKIISVKVSGICFDPAQPPATQDAFIYAYADKKTWTEITNMPINQRLIVRLKNVHSHKDVERVSNVLVEKLKKSGIDVQTLEIPKFNEHPHQWQLNTLLFLIGTIGLLAFIMGAVLVSQLMRSILTSQIRQIGIMKSIGATRNQILGMYVTMLVIIGLISGLIAIPLAVKSGNAFSYFVASKLNFNILTTSVPLKVYVYLILASVSLPILLSFPILLKGVSTSVKNAITDYGISQKSSAYRFRFLKKLGLNYTTQLALKNSLRNTKRLSVTILAMALGAAIFDTGFNVRQSLWTLLSGVKEEMRFDVQVVLTSPIQRTDFLKWFENIDNVKTIEPWIGGRGAVQSKINKTDNGAGIIALPESSAFLKLKIVEGRWILPSTDFEVVLNQQAMTLYGNPTVGSMINITVGDTSFTAHLVGVAEQFEIGKIYCDIQKYNAILNPSQAVNTLTFVAKKNDFNSVLELKKNIEKAIEPSDLKVLYVMSQAERVKIIYDHLDIILSTIIILSFLVLVVSAIGMASATGINIWERTREIGIMRSIGATPKMIYKLFIIEGLLTSVLSIVLGLIMAYPLSQLAAVFFGNLMLGEDANLQYAFSVSGFVITIVVTLLFGFLASRFPAIAAIKMSTQKALAYE
jgi:putative ABC transport system permease protein